MTKLLVYKAYFFSILPSNNMYTVRNSSSVVLWREGKSTGSVELASRTKQDQSERIKNPPRLDNQCCLAYTINIKRDLSHTILLGKSDLFCLLNDANYETFCTTRTQNIERQKDLHDVVLCLVSSVWVAIMIYQALLCVVSQYASCIKRN